MARKKRKKRCRRKAGRSFNRKHPRNRDGTFKRKKRRKRRR